MANNSAALAQGTKIAKDVIRTNMLMRMNNLLGDMVGDMLNRMQPLPGMTGNTKTSPAGASYDHGELIDINVTGRTNGTNPPIQSKLRKGQKFQAGRIRYDGDEQSKTFKATIDTTGNTSQEDNIRLLESMKGGKDFKVVITGASEYLGATQVSDNFAYCQTNVDKYFQHQDV